MDFIPLDLWRASSLAGETKAVIAAYERCLAAGDFEALAALRQAIEARIAELEDFYTRHLEDERSILFDKQRMKLRKLLHEYDQAVASLQQQHGGAAAPSAAASPAQQQALMAQHVSQLQQQMQQQMMMNGGLGSSGGGNGGGGGAGAGSGVTRDITEKSRLTLAELSAWFSQAGFAELREKLSSGEVRCEVTLPILEQVFRNVTRTNLDGKMSIRDVRQWYVSYGRRALSANIGNFDGELVPVGLLKSGAAAAVAAAAKKGTAPLPPIPKGLYSWAEEGGEEGSGAAGSGGGAGGAPMGLPNHMLEFQVRLTEAEFRQMCLRRRQYEGELKFKERIVKAEKAKVEQKARTIGADVPSALRDSAFVDASNPTNYLFRSGVTHG